MDAAQALADLTQISSQIEAAVLFSGDGSVQGSTLGDDGASAELARGAVELLESAGGFRSDGAAVVTQLEASTPEGSVFVVRVAETGIVALTGPQPTVGLVFYDLKSALRSAGEPAKPRRRRRTAPQTEESGGDAA